ncbi:hypothetical protein EU803_15775 [Loktanella sp. IMCC34160]|uniref:type II secretion system F family protein n=1 Tax=Loktanella sp. IMCC34160 TaxID=2510646 RepID=UPI00101CF613|nr:type II secretion system F family protein [Loktanella sp. IMCC34160]RYG90070.1 hypothetical protein EU803_15775 [Loktanella sp. IMCC34160]
MGEVTAYSYKAVDGRGAEVSGRLSAASRAAAMTELERRGLAVFELTEGASTPPTPWYRRDILVGGPLKDRDLATLSETLAQLLGRGIRLDEALEIAARGLGGREAQKHLAELSAGLRRGSSLGLAIEERSGAFPQTFRSMIAAGDAANRLVEAFAAAARFYAGLAKARAGVVTALAYPAFLLLAGLGVLTLILVYLTPALAGVLPDDPEKGTTIRRLDALRLWLAGHWGILLPAAAALGLGLALLRGTILRGLSRLVPPLRDLRAASEWGQIARLLQVLLVSGAGLDQALGSVAGLRSDQEAAGVLSEAASALRRGGRAAPVFAQDDSVPHVFQRLFALGEEADTLPDMMDLAATRLEATRDATLKRLVGLVTPLATLVIGGLIAALVWVLMGAVLEVSQIAV